MRHIYCTLLLKSGLGQGRWQSMQQKFICCVLFSFFSFLTLIRYCRITPFGCSGANQVTAIDVDEVLVADRLKTCDGTKNDTSKIRIKTNNKWIKKTIFLNNIIGKQICSILKSYKHTFFCRVNFYSFLHSFTSAINSSNSYVVTVSFRVTFV